MKTSPSGRGSLLLSSLISAAGAFVPGTLLGATAAENWTGHCAKCHGAEGKGDTKIARKLKIEDFTLPEVQKKFTDEQAFDAIKNGLKRDGKTVMNALGNKLSDEEITEMVSLVRSMCSQ